MRIDAVDALQGAAFPIGDEVVDLGLRQESEPLAALLPEADALAEQDNFDDAFIKANAKSDACLVIFTGLQEGQSIEMEKTGAVKALDEVAKF